MMMETYFDPFENFILNDPFFNETDPFPIGIPSELSDHSEPLTNPEINFDVDVFQGYLDELLASEENPNVEQNEDKTREMGTDPMEPYEPVPAPIENVEALKSSLMKTPIIIIKSNNPNALNIGYHQQPGNIIFSVPAQLQSYQAEVGEVASNVELTTSDSSQTLLDMMTPSPSNDSSDESRSLSPDLQGYSNQNSLITNLAILPKSGPLVLTDEELKLIKQEGQPIPTKLPLSKADERLLKRIQRKIKNKISAQESRRKKKEYVDALEKRIAECLDENKSLKERVNKMEKSQKTLTQERDLLRSLMNQGKSTPSTALMVFALFFAVLIGAWSPMNNKGVIDEQSPNNNSPVGLPNFLFSTQKQIIENPEKLQAKPIDDSFKSRVLLSIDEQEHQNQQAPNSSPIDFSRTLETFRNKRRRTEDPRFPPKNFIVIEEGVPTFDSMTNRTQKIIRVERTRPSAFNDTLKLAKQFSDH